MATERLDHRAFLASLTVEQRAELTERSDRFGLMHLSVHWGAILVVGALIALRMPFWWLLLPVQGVLIIFLFTLLHETVHMTPFKTAWLNRGVGAICGILVAVPPVWFRYFHLAHHKHTHDPDHDPELTSPKPNTGTGYVIHLSGLPAWWGQFKVMVESAIGRCDAPYIPVVRRGEVIREARLMLGLYLGLVIFSAGVGSSLLLWIWVIPILLGQPVLRAYLLAEHGRCASVANMFENTRTTFTNRLVRALAWNMPYHAEHHAQPNVPFHRLPALHALTRPHLRATSDGYRAFHRDYAKELK